MEKTIIAYYNSRQDAENSVHRLREKGFTDNDISILAREGEDDSSGGSGSEMSFQDQNLTDGTVTGGAIGGIAGLALGAGALLIPGFGPIIAAGPLAGVLTGALTGGVAGGLVDYGIPEESSRRFEQHLESGKVLAIVKTAAERATEAMQILDESGGKEIEMH